MGSKVTLHRARIKKSEYEALKNSLDCDYFYNFYLNNCNDYVCREFNINLSTVYMLVRDFDISLTAEQKKYRNKISGEQKCLEIHGVLNPFAAKSVQEKIKETNLSKYGVENIFAADCTKDKIKQTNLERYGTEYASQNKDVIQKTRDTNFARYGVYNYAQTDECKEKSKKTCLERYGVEHSLQSKEVREKGVQTCLERYGVEHTACLPEVQEKAKLTSLARFGATHYSRTFDFHNRIRKHYICKDQSFDSLPELAVWVYCIDNNISIKKNPCSFEYNYCGKNYNYFPDFEIDGKLVEIKGDHFFKEDGTMQNPFDHDLDDLYEAKHLCGLDNGVEFWRKADYWQYVQYFTENYDVADYIFKKNDEE